MKVIFLEPDQTIEDLLPGVGLVEAGKSFLEFTTDLIEHRDNPYCTTLAIPADLNWYIDPDPEVGDFRHKSLAEHRAFLRFQLCLWIHQDEKYTKPIVLNGVTSIDELRMLSGISNIEAVYLPRTGVLAMAYDDRFEFYMAANDKDSIQDLFDEMAENGSEFSWQS